MKKADLFILPCCWGKYTPCPEGYTGCGYSWGGGAWFGGGALVGGGISDSGAVADA